MQADQPEKSIRVAGEELVLLPEKMVWWPKEQTLLVADLHFGKAATFRNGGIPVPAGTTGAMLDRLSSAIEKYSANRLLMLGDFVHSATRSGPDFEHSIRSWRLRNRDLEWQLVQGNHDRGHDQLFSDLEIQVLLEPYQQTPFSFCHFADANSDPALYTLAGHVHPGIRLSEPNGQSIRVPCFLFGPHRGILPAFGVFTGLSTIEVERDERVFGVVEDQVIELSGVVAR